MKTIYYLKKGFSLIEMMLVLVVISTIAVIKTQEIKSDEENRVAGIAAEQIKKVAQATNAYISLNYKELADLNSQGVGGLNCQASGTCTITIDTLKDNFLLPQEFNKTSLTGNPYIIELKRKGTAPNFMIDGLVLTNYKGGKNAERSQIFGGKILNKIGIDGGISNSTGINGMYGGWKATATDYTSVDKDMVGVLVGYSSNMYSIYLRRDGTLPMTGDLNLDKNNIKNIKNAEADRIDAKSFFAGDELRSNKVSVLSGRTEINDGTLTVKSQALFHSPVSVKTDMNVDGKTYLNGITYLTGTSLIGTNIDAQLKSLSLSGNQNTGGTLTVSGRTTLKNGADLTGDLTARNNITASGNIRGNYLIASSVSVAGAVCGENGLISKDNKGALLTCVSGRWTSAGGGGLGYNQQWYSWGGGYQQKERQKGVEYVNNTDKPIFVVVSGYMPSDKNDNGSSMSFSVDGKTVGRSRGGYNTNFMSSISAVVPVGSRYRFDLPGYDYTWAELR